MKKILFALSFISALAIGSSAIGPGGGITTLTGDVTAGPGSGSQAATIANDAVTNAKLANMATQTFKGRTTAGTGDPEDLTATQATALLNALVGDSGSGGTKGLAPAPSAGDAAAGKYLKADGTWAVPSGGVSIGGAVTGGTSGSVLFVDGSGNLGQNNAAFNWNDTTKKLSLTNATATDGTMLTVTATDTGAAGSAHGGIQSVYTASNAASTLPSAIYASSTAGVASAPAIGIYSKVSAGGQIGVDAAGIYVAQSSSNYNTYSGIYVEGPSTGTVAFDNYSLNVSTGNSFFGGELAVVTTKSGGTSTGALRSVITQTGTPNTVGAMYAESSTGANNTQVIGLVSKVLNTGGYTGNNGFGIAIPAQSGDWSNYYGLYISGASSGTVTTNNRALHVNSGASYFGGSIIANTLTASEAVATDANKNLVSVAGVSATELGYLSAVTSDIQTQLDGKQATGNYITALTGDVTASGPGSVAATIANSAVTNAKMADMATQTFKGRTTAGTGVPEDLTATQATAILNAMVGDSGAGGTKGLVPAPSSGDAAANKFLKADGTWSSVGIVTTATENISASGSIASSTVVTYQYRRIQGNSAAVTASSTPFGAGGGWVDGTLIRLVGQSSTNTVTITHNDAAKGAILNGDCTLGQYDTLDLQYDSTADRWIETARSIK